MKLINNLITNTDELEARCRIRNSFLKLGLQDNLTVQHYFPSHSLSLTLPSPISSLSSLSSLSCTPANITPQQFRQYTGDEYQRLEQQIDHFEEVMNDDGEEIALRFKQGQADGKVPPLPLLTILSFPPTSPTRSANITNRNSFYLPLACKLRASSPRAQCSRCPCALCCPPCRTRT